MEKYLEIRARLIDDSITYSTALEEIKRLPKAWHTKHWKEMRDKHLKDKCENCGSTEPPLVIQHTKQPHKFNVLYQQVLDKHFDIERVREEVAERVITEENIENYLKENSVIRGACAECATINIRKNNKKNIYICVKQHTFETPVDVLYYSASRTTDYDKARESAISKLQYFGVSEEVKRIRTELDLQVGKEALLRGFEEGIEYRLFKNIKTCCKRCAAVEDGIVRATSLCKECKMHYHASVYEKCFHCWNAAN